MLDLPLFYLSPISGPFDLSAFNLPSPHFPFAFGLSLLPLSPLFYFTYVPFLFQTLLSLLLHFFLCLSLFSPFSLSVELSSLSLCMTNSKLGEPCFYVIGRTENTRLVIVPVSSPIFCLSTSLYQSPVMASLLEKMPHSMYHCMCQTPSL